MHRTLVEVREPKENSSRQQRPASPKASLQKVLHPSAKEKLLRDRNKEKREDPPQNNVRQRWNVSMQVEKSEPQSKQNSGRRIDHELAPANPQIGQPKAKIEADTLQPAE